MEWKARLSETSNDGDWISCNVYTAYVHAETEEEARSIITEEEPDLCIDSIEKVDDSPSDGGSDD